MITIGIIFATFLLWNIFNETLFLKYNGIKSRIFQRDWHLYDAIFRIVLFTTAIVNKFGVTYFSGKLLLVLFLLYHILFDIGFNIKRNKDNKWQHNFNSIFHVGGGTIDGLIKTPRRSFIIKLIELISILWILLSL